VFNFLNLIEKFQNTKASLLEGISTYDAEVVKRGAKEVKMSVETAYMMHDWDQLMESPVMKHGVTKMS
jgi:hypothetical protein